jgi:hypothetical protein
MGFAAYRVVAMTRVAALGFVAMKFAVATLE